MLETRVLKSRSRSRQLLVSVVSEENRMKFSPSISLVLGFRVSAQPDGFGGWRGMRRDNLLFSRSLTSDH